MLRGAPESPGFYENKLCQCDRVALPERQISRAWQMVFALGQGILHNACSLLGKSWERADHPQEDATSGGASQ